MTRTRRTIALLVGIAVAATAAVETARAADDRPAYLAIWKIIDTKRRNQATAVAVSPTRALTNAHVLYGFVRKESTDLVLKDDGGRETLDIIGPIAVSATYDLALVEMAEPMPRNLHTACSFPLGRADRLHPAGHRRSQEGEELDGLLDRRFGEPLTYGRSSISRTIRAPVTALP